MTDLAERWRATFRPRPPGYHRGEVLRGVVGAIVGLAVAGGVVRLMQVSPEAVPYLVAPMGATAVLLFAAPASPLAQPWQVVVGNVSSAGVGVVAAKAVDDVLLAGSVAVGVAIGLMMLLRCVHPPGGACALFTAVGGPAVASEGFFFAVSPVAVNTVLLLLVATAVNNLTGRPYPHVPEPTGAVPGPRGRVGVDAGDVAEAMQRLDRGLDVMPGDVVALVREAEAHALDRRLGRLTCETVMERDVPVVLPDDTAYRARILMNAHHVKAVPVVDAERRVVGILTVYDLFNLDVANVASVSSLMSSPVRTVRTGTPVSELVELMTDRGLRHVPVVDEDERLVGIVTRSELIAVLNAALVESRGG